MMAASAGPEIVEDGLVLYLDAANERSYPGTGTSWTDLSKSGNNGNIENGALFNASNKCMTFDGSNDRVVCGNWSLSYLTISVWLRTGSSGSNKGICRKQRGWALSQYQRYLQVAPGVSWRFYNTGYIIPATNNWININYSYSGTGAPGSQSVYVDGDLIYQDSVGSTGLPSNSNEVRVGYDDNNWWWNGDIAHIKIYDRALTAEEIKQNFNATRSRFGI